MGHDILDWLVNTVHPNREKGPVQFVVFIFLFSVIMNLLFTFAGMYKWVEFSANVILLWLVLLLSALFSLGFGKLLEVLKKRTKGK